MGPTPPIETAQAHVERARAAAPGRSVYTVHGRHDRALRQTVVALRAGATLHEHHNAREATLQVLAATARWVR